MSTSRRGVGERSEFWFWVARQQHTLRSLAAAAGVPYYRIRYHSAGFRRMDDVDLQRVACAVGHPVSEIPTFDVVWSDPAATEKTAGGSAG